jgi:hypothetical protein
MGADMRNKISIRLKRSYQSYLSRIRTTFFPNLPSRCSAVIRGAAVGATVGAGAKKSIPLPHHRARGAASEWPSVSRDHLYLEDASAARIDALV